VIGPILPDLAATIRLRWLKNPAKFRIDGDFGNQLWLMKVIHGD
jgi:hypothetical protein